jgi:hypothetical protein
VHAGEGFRCRRRDLRRSDRARAGHAAGVRRSQGIRTALGLRGPPLHEARAEVGRASTDLAVRLPVLDRLEPAIPMVAQRPPAVAQARVPISTSTDRRVSTSLFPLASHPTGLSLAQACPKRGCIWHFGFVLLDLQLTSELLINCNQRRRASSRAQIARFRRETARRSYRSIASNSLVACDRIDASFCGPSPARDS